MYTFSILITSRHNKLEMLSIFPLEYYIVIVWLYDHILIFWRSAFYIWKLSEFPYVTSKNTIIQRVKVGGINIHQKC